jgi:large subunit ribosomal protein L18
MPKDKNARHLRKVRQERVRKKVSGTPERPRLSVFRSLKHIYAQVIDDSTGRTIVAASSQETLQPTGDGTSGSKTDVSGTVGKTLAEKALAAGVTRVVFDRGGCKYHGRVKALAEGSREGGLQF